MNAPNWTVIARCTSLSMKSAYRLSPGGVWKAVPRDWRRPETAQVPGREGDTHAKALRAQHQELLQAGTKRRTRQSFARDAKQWPDWARIIKINKPFLGNCAAMGHRFSLVIWLHMFWGCYAHCTDFIARFFLTVSHQPSLRIAAQTLLPLGTWG